MLNYFWPLRITRPSVAEPLGLVVVLAALGLALWGIIVMHGAGTNISPLKPATTLVDSGPYRFSRNPLYVAMTLLFVGLTLLINSWWGVVLPAPVILLLHFGVVRREERYLERALAE